MSSSEPLKPCPCGKVPTELSYRWDSWTIWAASGNCCGLWHIPFDAKANNLPDAELNAIGERAWNSAPRGERDE